MLKDKDFAAKMSIATSLILIGAAIAMWVARMHMELP